MDTYGIEGLAMGMKMGELMTGIQTSMLKKTMDVVENQAQGIVDMANSLPKFSGDIGQALDVRA